MSDIKAALVKKRHATFLKIERLKQQLVLIDQMIKDTDKEEKTPRKNKTNLHSQSAFNRHLIKKIIREDETGRTAKDIHHLLEIALKEDFNYGTLRTYLFRMKKEKTIFQDDKKKWHVTK